MEVQAPPPISDMGRDPRDFVQDLVGKDKNLGNGDENFSFINGVNYLQVKQDFEAVEVAAQFISCCPSCVEGENSYKILTEDDFEPGKSEIKMKQIMKGQERSWMLGRCLCGPNHRATLDVQEMGKPDVGFDIKKKLRPNCFPCIGLFKQKQVTFVKVHGGKTKVGSSRKVCSRYCFTPTFELKDKDDKVYGHVYGPTCCTGGLMELTDDIPFYIYDLKGNQVAEVLKLKPNCLNKDMSLNDIISILRCDISKLSVLKEMAGDADNYSLTYFQPFNVDDGENYWKSIEEEMDNEHKTNLLATLLLLDYVFYEAGPPCAVNPSGRCSLRCCTLYCCGLSCGCEDACCVSVCATLCLYSKQRKDRRDRLKQEGNEVKKRKQEKFFELAPQTSHN